MIVLSRSYDAPSICKKDILRYAGCSEANGETLALLELCLKETEKVFSYKVCFCELPLAVTDDLCDLGVFSVRSDKLAKNLDGCSSVILFAATVGVGIDRLIAKGGRISPAKALMFQAIGTERIEALCAIFCEDMEKEKGRSLRPRFSAGYGDLPLDIQRDIFKILGCSGRIGLTLNDSLLMIPSKSVTAFVGITNKK